MEWNLTTDEVTFRSIPCGGMGLGAHFVEVIEHPKWGVRVRVPSHLEFTGLKPAPKDDVRPPLVIRKRGKK